MSRQRRLHEKVTFEPKLKEREDKNGRCLREEHVQADGATQAKACLEVQVRFECFDKQ